MRFDWTGLRVFLHVCESGTMTGAAARCHLTVAAVSARIRALEDGSGALLLHRHARGVTPTPAGEVLAEHARRMFDLVQELEQGLMHAPRQACRPAVLLANSSALARPLAEAVAEVVPGAAALRVRESPSEATVQALRCGAADLGIVSDAVDTRGLATHPLGPDPLVLVTPPGHPLAARETVSFAQVLGQAWVGWGERSALAAHLQLRALAAGARITPCITYPAVAGVLRLVGRGLGVSVLPEVIVREDPAGAQVSRVALAEPWARRRLLVCHAPGRDGWPPALAQRLAREWNQA